MSDSALVDRARAPTLDALETLLQAETVPLWFFVLVASEMVPLLPTQPMALTSGIVFGAGEGHGGGARGERDRGDVGVLRRERRGRALAEKVVAEETGDDESGSFRSQWRELRTKLDAAKPAEQTALIALFRIAPHPFSASNYLFGLTQIRASPYVVGTAAGIAPWATLYACVGASGRALLDGGEAVDEVFADLGALIASDVEIGEEALSAVAAAVLLLFVARRLYATSVESADAEE